MDMDASFVCPDTSVHGTDECSFDEDLGDELASETEHEDDYEYDESSEESADVTDRENSDQQAGSDFDHASFLHLSRMMHQKKLPFESVERLHVGAKAAFRRASELYSKHEACLLRTFLNPDALGILPAHAAFFFEHVETISRALWPPLPSHNHWSIRSTRSEEGNHQLVTLLLRDEILYMNEVNHTGENFATHGGPSAKRLPNVEGVLLSRQLCKKSLTQLLVVHKEYHFCYRDFINILMLVFVDGFAKEFLEAPRKFSPHQISLNDKALCTSRAVVEYSLTLTTVTTILVRLLHHLDVPLLARDELNLWSVPPSLQHDERMGNIIAHEAMRKAFAGMDIDGNTTHTRRSLDPSGIDSVAEAGASRAINHHYLDNDLGAGFTPVLRFLCAEMKADATFAAWLNSKDRIRTWWASNGQHHGMFVPFLKLLPPAFQLKYPGVSKLMMVMVDAAFDSKALTFRMMGADVDDESSSDTGFLMIGLADALEYRRGQEPEAPTRSFIEDDFEFEQRKYMHERKGRSRPVVGCIGSSHSELPARLESAMHAVWFALHSDSEEDESGFGITLVERARTLLISAVALMIADKFCTTAIDLGEKDERNVNTLAIASGWDKNPTPDLAQIVLQLFPNKPPTVLYPTPTTSGPIRSLKSVLERSGRFFADGFYAQELDSTVKAFQETNGQVMMHNNRWRGQGDFAAVLADSPHVLSTCLLPDLMFKKFLNNSSDSLLYSAFESSRHVGGCSEALASLRELTSRGQLDMNESKWRAVLFLHGLSALSSGCFDEASVMLGHIIGNDGQDSTPTDVRHSIVYDAYYWRGYLRLLQRDYGGAQADLVVFVQNSRHMIGHPLLPDAGGLLASLTVLAGGRSSIQVARFYFMRASEFYRVSQPYWAGRLGSWPLPRTIKWLSSLLRTSKRRLRSVASSIKEEVHAEMDDSSGYMCSNLACSMVGKTRKCAVCMQVRYCCEDCQKKHWPLHKEVCREMASAAPSLHNQEASTNEKVIPSAGIDQVSTNTLAQEPNSQSSILASSSNPGQSGEKGLVHEVGATVRVEGLYQASHLNGAVGKVLSFDIHKQRYAVQVDVDVGRKKQQNLSIRGQNLFPISDDWVGNMQSRTPEVLLESRNLSSTSFTVGAKVEVVGLRQSPELNGCEGLIKSFNIEKQRYGVRVTIQSESICHRDVLLQAHNLVLLKSCIGHKQSPEPRNDDIVAQEQESSMFQALFSPGTDVTVQGLHKAAHLNGCRGVVKTYDASKQRYVVSVRGKCVHDSEHVISVCPDNLLRDSPQHAEVQGKSEQSARRKRRQKKHKR